MPPLFRPATRRRRAPRSRAIIAWLVGAYVALQMGAGIVFDYFLPRVRFPELYGVVAQTRNLPNSPDLLVLGSSRFGGLVVESELTHELRQLTGQSDFRAQNCCVSGGDPIAQERVLREVLAAGAAPRFVVFESSPEFLNRHCSFYDLHAHRQLDWEDLPRHGLQICTSNRVARLFQPRFAPLYAHRYQFLKQVGTAFAPLARPAPLGPRAPMSEAEWVDLRTQPRPLTETQKVGLYSVTAPDLPYLRNYQMGGAALRAIDDAIAACQSCGIRAIFVGGPAASVYRAKYTPAILASYETFVDHLRAQANVDYIECRAALPDHLFGDTHHAFSAASGIVFSRYLAREALGPILRSPVPARTVGYGKHP